VNGIVEQAADGGDRGAQENHGDRGSEAEREACHEERSAPALLALRVMPPRHHQHERQRRRRQQDHPVDLREVRPRHPADRRADLGRPRIAERCPRLPKGTTDGRRPREADGERAGAVGRAPPGHAGELADEQREEDGQEDFRHPRAEDRDQNRSPVDQRYQPVHGPVGNGSGQRQEPGAEHRATRVPGRDQQPGTDSSVHPRGPDQEHRRHRAGVVFPGESAREPEQHRRDASDGHGQDPPGKRRHRSGVRDRGRKPRAARPRRYEVDRVEGPEESVRRPGGTQGGPVDRRSVGDGFGELAEQAVLVTHRRPAPPAS
jgi:hypothetical protein